MSTDRLPKSLSLLIDNGQLARMLSRGVCLLFSRHSDRPMLPPKTCGPTVSLTPNGVGRARRLGQTLNELGVKPGPALICSPITRNIQTVTEICTGAGWENHLGLLQLDARVMGPGTIYEVGVNVEDVVASYFGSGFGSYEIFNEIIAGREKAYYAVRSFPDAVVSILALIKETLLLPITEETRNGLSIIISHDMHVAYVLAKMFNKRQFTADDWPPFLDSILFQLVHRGENTGLIAVYGDQVAEMDHCFNVISSDAQ